MDMKRDKMEKRYPDAVDIAEKMKDGARAAPWVPMGIAPRERYHHLPDGLNLCLTVDIISDELVEAILRINRVTRIKPGSFWHLSVARTKGANPTAEEVSFWRETFFTEEPDVELSGESTGINSRHFFWRIDMLDNPPITP